MKRRNPKMARWTCAMLRMSCLSARSRVLSARVRSIRRRWAEVEPSDLPRKEKDRQHAELGAEYDVIYAARRGVLADLTAAQAEIGTAGMEAIVAWLSGEERLSREEVLRLESARDQAEAAMLATLK
jgi:hypothetical protein